jgi:hypothetical protein
MSMLAATLLQLYPREWRRRYGGEMAAMLGDQPLTLRSATDLLAGAIDARLNSQWTRSSTQGLSEAGGSQAKGATMSTRILRSTSVGVTRADEWRSAAWMVGGSLVLTLISIGLQAVWRENAFSESLLYAAFPASLMLSNECLYFKPYSRAARFTLSLGGAVFIILMMWGAVLLGNRI